MLCRHCGACLKGTHCNICKKSNSVKSFIQELRTPECCDPTPVRYACPWCGERRVKEIVIHNDGQTIFYYNLDLKCAPAQEDWATLENSQILDTICAACEMPLSKDDQLHFLEETETWLDE